MNPEEEWRAYKIAYARQREAYDRESSRNGPLFAADVEPRCESERDR